mgnify:CR=1 FL=1
MQYRRHIKMTILRQVRKVTIEHIQQRLTHISNEEIFYNNTNWRNIDRRMYSPSAKIQMRL